MYGASSPSEGGWPYVGTLISCRRIRGWGYGSGEGSMSESPVVVAMGSKRDGEGQAMVFCFVVD